MSELEFGFATVETENAYESRIAYQKLARSVPRMTAGLSYLFIKMNGKWLFFIHSRFV